MIMMLINKDTFSLLQKLFVFIQSVVPSLRGTCSDIDDGTTHLNLDYSKFVEELNYLY
jgi:hypothetical protein